MGFTAQQSDNVEQDADAMHGRVGVYAAVSTNRAELSISVMPRLVAASHAHNDELRICVVLRRVVASMVLRRVVASIARDDELMICAVLWLVVAGIAHNDAGHAASRDIIPSLVCFPRPAIARLRLVAADGVLPASPAAGPPRRDGRLASAAAFPSPPRFDGRPELETAVPGS